MNEVVGKRMQVSLLSVLAESQLTRVFGDRSSKNKQPSRQHQHKGNQEEA